MSNAPNVVLHVSDKPTDVTRALGSARTLHHFRPDLRIRIIVNGPAIAGVTRDADALDLPDFATVEACEVGMRSHRIASEDLQAGVAVTASAVVALTDAQLDGAAYVRI